VPPGEAGGGPETARLSGVQSALERFEKLFADINALLDLEAFGDGWNGHGVDYLMTVNGCDVFTFKGGKIAVKSSFFTNRTSSL
jgi:hypothetical protein